MTAWRFVALACALAVAVVIALGVGAVAIPPTETLAALLGGGDDGMVAAIVRDVRLPRVILAAAAGAGLAVSGATLQGVLRNPLAEPYLLGVSGGAAVGAVTVTAFGVQQTFGVAGAAFFGAAAAVGLVLMIARGAAGSAWGRFDPRLLLMAGVVVGAFANAAIMVVLAGASPTSVRGALWWMMGSFADASWREVAWLVPTVAIGSAAVWIRARDIDALSLGDDAAAALGASVDRAARLLFLGAALLAAATVAAAGLIGFVGLMVPAIARALGARRAPVALAASALCGATLLVLADAVARTVRAPAELPVGAVTALIGVPFFLVQLRRVR